MRTKVGHKAAPATKTASAPTHAQPQKAKPAKSRFTFAPTPVWHAALPPLPAPAKDAAQPTPAQLASLAHKAAALHDADLALYSASTTGSSSAVPTPAGGPSPSDAAFLSQILSHGTLSDRLSALTLLVQGSPVHNTKALESLRALAERGKGKGGREESLKAVRCIVDWWVGGGGAERKLRYFRDQPLLNPNVTDAHLVVWHFEDWLKKFFFSFLQILETLSLDPLAYVRTQTLSFLASLLTANPEQEHNLLRLLANKLGDADKPVASRASYHLLQVLHTHPAMKGVIVREVSALVLRPVNPTASTVVVAAGAEGRERIKFADAAGAKDKGKETTKGGGVHHLRYYATITFNQIILLPTPQDRDVARKLLDVYFEMFREILGEGRSAEAESSEAADPKGKKEKHKGKGKGKGKDRHSKKGTSKGKPNAGKGKEKEVPGAAGFAEVEDAESRLVSAILTGINRALPYAKVDVGDPVFNKHIDTLFLITHTSTFNTSLQALTLLLHICTSLSSPPPSSTTPSTATATPSLTAKSITDRYFRTLYTSLHDPRLPRSSKHALYLNLLFKSLKLDRSAPRLRAFVRRFVQVLVSGTAGGGGSEFVAGGLFLLGELFNVTPGLREMLSTPAPLAEDAEGLYDPRKRDPQHAHADASPLWELLPLLTHYHPTISLHAAQLLSGTPLTATPDLTLNTLSHFLDRFVYKNPKKPKPRGTSAMQPGAAALSNGVMKIRGEVGGGGGAGEGGGTVRDKVFTGKRREDVDVSELFFHRYFEKKREKEGRIKGKVGKRRGVGSDEDEDEGESEGGDEGEDAAEDGGDDEEEGEEEAAAPDEDEDGSDDEEEKEIWQAMKASMPKMDGDSDLDLMDDDSEDGGSEEDEDEIPSGLDDMSDSGSDSDDVESDLEAQEDGADEEDQSDLGADDNDSDAFSLAEASDAEDLLDLDAEVPTGLIEYDGSDAGAQSDGAELGEPLSKKRKREQTERKEKRKKLRSLPTFASYEDYAKMIEDEPEDNI